MNQSTNNAFDKLLEYEKRSRRFAPDAQGAGDAVEGNRGAFLKLGDSVADFKEPQATRRPRLGKSSEASGTRGVVRLWYAVERSRLPPQAGAGKRDSLLPRIEGPGRDV